MADCKRCGEKGFDDGWEWLCPCDGRTVQIDSFSTPRFNIGLGCMTSSIRETEKIAKTRGLLPIGSERLPREAPDKPIKPILLDGLKRLKARSA